MDNPQLYDEKHKAYRPATNGGGVWFPGKGGYPRDTSMFEDQPEDPGPAPLPDYANDPPRYETDSELQDSPARADSRYPDYEPYPGSLPPGRAEYEPHTSEPVHFLGERSRGRAHTTRTLLTVSCLSFALGGAVMFSLIIVIPAVLIALLNH